MHEYLGLLADTERRVYVVTNYSATNADGFDRVISTAIHDFDEDPALRGRLIIGEQRDNFGHTLEDMQKEIRPGDFLVVVGGDGSVNAAAEAILGHTDEEVRDTVALLTMPAGNTNLGSNDLLSKLGNKESIRSIFGRGEVLDFSPMGMTIYNPLIGTQFKLALFLSGVGAPGHSERKIELSRKHKFLRQFSAIRFPMDVFSVVSGAHDQNKEPLQMVVNGRPFEGAGVITANVNRYAKVLKTPSEARKPGFNSLVFEDPHLLSESRIALGALWFGRNWLYTGPGESLEIGVVTKPGQKLLHEQDAEVKEIAGDDSEEVRTSITQRVHHRTIKMVALSRL